MTPHEVDAPRSSAWVDHATIGLGVWLAASPWSFGYAAHPAGWSDALSGLLLVGLALLSIFHRAAWRWAVGAVGIWVLTAPIVLPDAPAVAFASGTVIGLAVFALALMVPGAPDARRLRKRGDGDAPTGWSYNPSSWGQRIVPVVFAVVAALVARGLAAYQLGYIPGAWDPFFGDGTERVLTSDVSQAFPVSDAALGMWGYLLDAVAGLLGGTRRWATMPWIVLLFGIFVIPFGIVSITLVILQPVVVGAWCTGCLVTALMSLLMIPFAADEVAATMQFLVRARRAGQPFWRTLWDGGALAYEPADVTRRRDGGVSFPPGIVAAALIGAVVMALPSLTGAEGGAATGAHLLGPLIVTFAVISIGEPVRAARFVLVPAGLALAATPWLLGGGTAAFAWSASAAGLLVVALSVRRGAIRGDYGSMRRYIV